MRQELTGVKSKRLEASRAYSGCRAVKRPPLLSLIEPLLSLIEPLLSSIERSRGGLCKVMQAPPPHFLLSVRMCRPVCAVSDVDEYVRSATRGQAASKRGASCNKQEPVRQGKGCSKCSKPTHTCVSVDSI